MPRKRIGGLSQLVLKFGLAKDERGANTLLLVVVVIATLVGIGVWWSGTEESVSGSQAKYELGAPKSNIKQK